MSFDIYGGNLQRGHCEVHPHVHEEYPCSVCISNSAFRKREQEDERRMYREMEDAYYAQMRGDIEYESWGST